MNFEQQIIADMAGGRVKLARDFAAVGEMSSARYMFNNAIEKLEMAKQVGAEDHAKLDGAIAQVRAEMSKLFEPDHGQKRSTSFLDVPSTNNPQS